MSGRLTPPEVTPLDRMQLMLLPIADRFMILMWSRPPGGSLRTARVTLVTIWLSALTAVIAGAMGVAALAAGLATIQLLPIVAGLLAVALAVGAGGLAVFGIRQRALFAAQKKNPAP